MAQPLPRPAGGQAAARRLAPSPFMVLLPVFHGALLRGMPAAFIGVALRIAAATLWEELEGGRFGARPMAGPAPP
ncbi:MAG: hypothetical protein ACK44F_10100 [Roseococcus sp.]